MDIRMIDTAFTEMIMKHRISGKLKMKSNAIRQIRYNIRRRKRKYSIDFKLQLLQRAGYRLDHFQYTHIDQVALARFILNTSQEARERGPEYLVQKFNSTRGDNRSVLPLMRG